MPVNVSNWTYMGVTVWPADFNYSGLRWSARVESAGYLHTDTKDGMKALIREAIANAK